MDGKRDERSGKDSGIAAMGEAARARAGGTGAPVAGEVNLPAPPGVRARKVSLFSEELRPCL